MTGLGRNANMYKVAFRNVEEYCLKCKKMKKMLDNVKKIKKMLQQENKEVSIEKLLGAISLDDLGDLRVKCTGCKCGIEGIYKADAIITALILLEIEEIKKKPVLSVGTGRKSTIKKETKEAIYRQIDEGISYKVIAQRTGWSEKTIYRLNKERKKVQNKYNNKL